MCIYTGYTIFIFIGQNIALGNLVYTNEYLRVETNDIVLGGFTGSRNHHEESKDKVLSGRPLNAALLFSLEIILCDCVVTIIGT